MTTRRTISVLSTLVVLVALTRPARGELFEPTFDVGGYLSVQTGIFVDPATSAEALDPDAKLVYPTEHGDKLGELSMALATLFLEADWAPWEPVALHAIFRGRRSLALPSDDRDAQPPFPTEVGDKGDWVRDRFYNELDLRELYVDITATDWLFLRVGRQQVTWGELGQYRLLDVVNPTDSTWHFGSLESFEDTRIPLWMLDIVLEVEPLAGALEIVYIPLFDAEEDTVSTPLTFVGAWGVPPAPVQVNKGVAAQKIHSKVFHYPGGDFEDGRIGLRWKGEAGPLTYSLAYMYTHQISPPVPEYYITPWKSGPQGIDVHLFFPRQHIVGGSLEIPFDSPLGMILRLEVAYEPNRTYSQYSLGPCTGDVCVGPTKIDILPSATSTETGATDVYTYFETSQKHVLSYGVQLLRPTMIRFLNPTQNFTFVLQFLHTVVLDFDRTEHILEVPGYDTSEADQHTYTLVFAATTNYVNGMIVPFLVLAYMPPPHTEDWGSLYGDGFLSVGSRFVIGDHWRLKLAYNVFWGDRPYRQVGFFRDRDEVNLTVMYQF